MRRWILGALLAVTVGCQPTVPAGVVVDKEFDPAHRERYMYAGKMPRYRRIPDRYYLTYEGLDIQDPLRKGGELRSRTIRVSRETFDQFEVGDSVFVD